MEFCEWLPGGVRAQRDHSITMYMHLFEKPSEKHETYS